MTSTAQWPAPRSGADAIALGLGAGALARREVGLWIGSVLAGRYLLEFFDPASGINQTGGKSLFRVFAWIVVMRLLASSAELGRARAADLGAFVLCALCAILPGYNAVWIATTLAAAYFWLTRNGDAYRSSAAVLLIALATNALWGPLLFNFVAIWLLDFDAWLLAKILQLMGVLTSHQGNQVIVGRGDVEIYGPCSSYHNISIALLIWLSVTKFARPTWVRSDAAFALAAVGITLAWNTVRLVVLAMTETNAPTFELWHQGSGASLFSAVLAFMIAAVSVAGASRARS